jgi:hypothetical protein
MGGLLSKPVSVTGGAGLNSPNAPCWNIGPEHDPSYYKGMVARRQCFPISGSLCVLHRGMYVILCVTRQGAMGALQHSSTLGLTAGFGLASQPYLKGVEAEGSNAPSPENDSQDWASLTEAGWLVDLLLILEFSFSR